MNAHSGFARQFGIGFSAFFCAVSVTALTVGLVKGEPAGIATGILMLGGGALFLASFVGGVRVDPGRSVGGGPLLAKVDLAPDESILVHAPAGYDRSRAGTRSISWTNLIGEVFVTDERAIFIPYVYAVRPTPSAIVYAEVASIDEGRSAPFLSSYGESTSLLGRDGSRHTIWSTHAAIDLIKVKAVAGAAPAAAPSLRYDATFGRLVQFAVAAVVIAMWGAFMFEPQPPFIRFDDGVTRFLLACLAIVLGVQAIGWVQNHFWRRRPVS